MGATSLIILLSLTLLLFLGVPCAEALCIDSRAPTSITAPLAFCPYNGTSCCSSADDLILQKQFREMNVSDSSCAPLLKSILCARCDPFAAELFRNASAPQQVPVLCNSTVSEKSTQISQAESNFCSHVWSACRNVSILNSPFLSPGRSPASERSNITTLIDLWQSETRFCNAFGGAFVNNNRSKCFDGQPVDLDGTGKPTPPSGMCLEKLGNGSFLNMVPHPDGSNRAFFSNQQGNIWLGTIPVEGSGGTLEIDESNPFLDLTDLVHFDTEFGLLGIALHPKFQQNGRFFASYNCDKSKWPECGGKCACNSEVKCDPSKLGPDNGAAPCQYQSVVAEFTANGTGSSQPSSEVRRIFTMGQPFTSHHGGQILFGPTDGYLYFMMGDGGGTGDPYNFAQNKKSLLGKIMRLDVDNIPSAAEISRLGLWGNYSIPKDNPFTSDEDMLPEIWALGLRNPWRCSFDSERPSYFVCADVGQDEYEEVNIIEKGGNYGWRVYEGPYLYTPPESPGGNTSTTSINPIFPVMGYNHSEVNAEVGSASITGGYFYRSTTDPCMYGRYLFADLYADSIWAGEEHPKNSGNYFTSEVSFACAHDSPLDCTFSPSKSFPALGYIFSFGEDNNKDIYILASSGVYRIARAGRCNYTCAKESNATAAAPDPSPSKASILAGSLLKNLIILLCCVLFA